MLEVTPSRYSLFLDQPSHCGNAGRPHRATSFLPSQFSPLHLLGDGRFLGMGSSSSKALNGVWLTDRKRKSDFQIHHLLTRPIVLPKVLCPRMSLRIFKHSPKKNILFFSNLIWQYHSVLHLFSNGTTRSYLLTLSLKNLQNQAPLYQAR